MSAPPKEKKKRNRVRGRERLVLESQLLSVTGNYSLTDLLSHGDTCIAIHAEIRVREQNVEKPLYMQYTLI